MLGRNCIRPRAWASSVPAKRSISGPRAAGSKPLSTKASAVSRLAGTPVRPSTSAKIAARWAGGGGGVAGQAGLRRADGAVSSSAGTTWRATTRQTSRPSASPPSSRAASPSRPPRRPLSSDGRHRRVLRRCGGTGASRGRRRGGRGATSASERAPRRRVEAPLAEAGAQQAGHLQHQHQRGDAQQRRQRRLAPAGPAPAPSAVAQPERGHLQELAEERRQEGPPPQRRPALGLRQRPTATIASGASASSR